MSKYDPKNPPPAPTSEAEKKAAKERGDCIVEGRLIPRFEYGEVGSTCWYCAVEGAIEQGFAPCPPGGGDPTKPPKSA